MKRREVKCICELSEFTRTNINENDRLNIYVNETHIPLVFGFDEKNKSNLSESLWRVLKSSYSNKEVNIDKEHLIIMECLGIIKKERISEKLYKIYY